MGNGGGGQAYICCKECRKSYYGVTWSDWNARTTSRRHGYCGTCYHNSKCLTYTSSSASVDMRCEKCNVVYNCVTYNTEWRFSGDVWRYWGYCSPCYHRKVKKREREKERQKLKQELEKQKKEQERLKKEQEERLKKQQEEYRKQQEEKRKEMEKKLQKQQEEQERLEKEQEEYREQMAEELQQQQEKQEKLEKERREYEERMEEELKKQQEEQERLEKEQKEYKKQMEQELEKQKKEQERLERQQKEHERKMKVQLKKQQIISQIEVKRVKLQQSMNVKNQLTKDYNQLKQKHQQIKIQVEAEEKEVSKFKVERTSKDCKLVTTIGITGHGKSTFCNRFCGDKSKEGNEGDFKVGEAMHSETAVIKKKTIIGPNNKKYSILDTPGQQDSENRDRQFTNKLVSYLKGCGGVNAFLVFIPLSEPRFSKVFKELLKEYQMRFGGKSFWKHVIIIATKEDSVRERLKDTRKQELQEIVSKEFELDFKIPIIPCGEKTFGKALVELFKVIPNNKYQSDSMYSPLDDLRKKEKLLKREKETLDNEIKNVKNKIQNLNKEIDNLQKQLNKI